MSLPKITIIIPVYNTAKYLRKCIDSVLNQTYQDFEIILVSDGPEEDDKICEEYVQKDNRISLIKGVNKGLGGARNAGIDVAKGEYIAFIDSDDWVEPTMLEKTLSYFTSDVDVVAFDTNIVLAQNSTLRIGEKDYLNLKFEGNVNIDLNKIFDVNVHAWNKIWRKDIIIENNIRFPEKMQYEDFPFYFHYFLLAKKAYFLKEPLYNYLRRSDSDMQKTYNRDFNCIVDHINGCFYLYNKLILSDVFEEYNSFLVQLYSRWIKTALWYCKKNDKLKLCKYANKTLKNMPKLNYKLNLLLRALGAGQYKDVVNGICEIKNIRLFGILPFLTLKKYETNRVFVYLLGIIPILGISTK